MTSYSVHFATLIIILVFAPTAVIYTQEIDFNIYEDNEDVNAEDGEPNFDIFEDVEIEYSEPDFDIYDDADIITYEEPDLNFFEGEKTEDAKPSNGPILVFNEGAAASWLTRIVKKTERSNFVFKDFLIGLYLRMDLENIKPVTPMLRLAVYYPFSSTFNDVPQYPNIPIHYAFDINTGIKFNFLDYKYFRMNLGPAVHLFFLNSERWNYLDIGLAAFLGIEAPLTKNWTFLLGGIASFDNGNLGGNRQMEPFDTVYQYQVEAGVRYSKKFANKTFLFARKPKLVEPSVQEPSAVQPGEIEMGETFLVR